MNTYSIDYKQIDGDGEEHISSQSVKAASFSDAESKFMVSNPDDEIFHTREFVGFL